MHRPCLGIIIGLILMLVWPGSPVFGKQASENALHQKIAHEKTHLKILQTKIRATKEKVGKAELREHSLLQTIETLDRRLVQKRRKEETLNQSLKRKDQEIAGIDRHVREVRATLAQRRQSISARLRLLYMEGRGSYIKALFTAETVANFQRRLDYLATITKHEYDLLTQYRSNLHMLETLEHQQTQARDELLLYKERTEKNIDAIQGIKRRKYLLLTSLGQEKALQERAVAGLERSAERVDTLLKSLDQQFKLAQTQSRRPMNRPLSRGALRWPADGKVVSLFGRQKHPTFDTYITKKGIEIKTSQDSPIHTVSQGTVVYADWLKGYGLVIIVDHLNGFFSLYAHASKLFVTEGDHVHKGQAIGETGETGIAETDTLYFELRKGTKPVDPLLWLAKQP